MAKKIHIGVCIGKGNGFSFSLFPIITLDKIKWVNKTEYDLLLGVWFWYVEINWTKKTIC